MSTPIIRKGKAPLLATKGSILLAAKDVPAGSTVIAAPVNSGVSVGDKNTGSIVVNDPAPLLQSQQASQAAIANSEAQSTQTITDLGNSLAVAAANNAAAVQAAAAGPASPRSNLALYASLAGLVLTAGYYLTRK